MSNPDEFYSVLIFLYTKNCKFRINLNYNKPNTEFQCVV